jgi:hypothetical protein
MESMASESPLTLPKTSLQKKYFANVTACFKKCKKCSPYLDTSGGQSSNLHLNVIHFFNTSVK